MNTKCALNKRYEMTEFVLHPDKRPGNKRVAQDDAGCWAGFMTAQWAADHVENSKGPKKKKPVCSASALICRDHHLRLTVKESEVGLGYIALRPKNE